MTRSHRNSSTRPIGCSPTATTRRRSSCGACRRGSTTRDDHERELTRRNYRAVQVALERVQAEELRRDAGATQAELDDLTDAEDESEDEDVMLPGSTQSPPVQPDDADARSIQTPNHRPDSAPAEAMADDGAASSSDAPPEPDLPPGPPPASADGDAMEADDVDEAASPAADATSQLLSQLADDLESFDDGDLDDGAAAAGAATQLADAPLDSGRRGDRLRLLRDELVNLLRSVRTNAVLTVAQQTEVTRLQKAVLPFASANEVARTMLGHLAQLAQLPVEASVDTGDPGDEEEEEEEPRIVGRASEMISGRQRHSFLLYNPKRRKKYEWLYDEPMRADPDLLAILEAYPGEKGADPSGDGFVKAIVSGRSSGRGSIKSSGPSTTVPVRYAEGDGEWIPKARIVNQALVDAFERGEESDSDDDDDDESAAAEGGGVHKTNEPTRRPILR